MSRPPGTSRSGLRPSRYALPMRNEIEFRPQSGKEIKRGETNRARGRRALMSTRPSGMRNRSKREPDNPRTGRAQQRRNDEVQTNSRFSTKFLNEPAQRPDRSVQCEPPQRHWTSPSPPYPPAPPHSQECHSWLPPECTFCFGQRWAKTHRGSEPANSQDTRRRHHAPPALAMPTSTSFSQSTTITRLADLPLQLRSAITTISALST